MLFHILYLRHNSDTMTTIIKTLDSRPRQDGSCNLKIVVRFSRNVRKTISTNVYILPKHWDKNKQLVTSKNENYLSINIHLSDIINRIMQSILEKETKGEEFTLADLELVLNPNKVKHDFIVFLKHKISNPSKSLSPGSVVNFNQCLRSFINYKSVVPASDINYKLITDFNDYLVRAGYNLNTISNIHSKIKICINEFIYEIKSIDKSVVIDNPYNMIKHKHAVTMRSPLTESQVYEIYGLCTNDVSLTYAKDAFVFICCTGLRKSDYRRVIRDMISDDGVLKIVCKKTKRSTGNNVVLHLKKLFNGIPYEILARYNFSLPVLKDRELNRLNKEMLGHFNLNTLFPHLGRHTFLTIMAEKTGNVFTVMALGGITSLGTAQKYIKAQQRASMQLDVLDDINWGNKD